MRGRIGLMVLCLMLIANLASAAAVDKVDAAAKSGKVAFIILYDQSALVLDSARGVAAEAARRVPGSVVIELDRGDQANSEFVTRYRASTAPVPLIMVASSTGVLAGAVPGWMASPEQLVKMVPSPKKSEIIKALSEGNAVFITASRKSMTASQSVHSACAVACRQMAGKSVQVRIDMDDAAETMFLQEMKVNLASTERVTLVANAQGQLAGTYTGAVQVTDLVSAAKKKVGGCCPSTVSNPNASCAPKKN